jgi:hypothetical protein
MSTTVSWVAIATMAMALAWCSVETHRGNREFALQRAAYCSENGGLYDFTWATCTVQAETKP